jgi:hypothetical protein
VGLHDGASVTWENVPITETQDVQDISWRLQFWRAVRERVLAAPSYDYINALGANYPLECIRSWLSSPNEPVIETFDGIDSIPPSAPEVGQRWLVHPDAAIQATYTDVRSLQNDPPASPIANNLYAVGSEPTGLWAGHANRLAIWRSGPQEWRFYKPRERRRFRTITGSYAYYVVRDGKFIDDAWRTHANMIATWTGSAWTFESPVRDSTMRFLRVNDAYWYNSGSTSLPLLRPLRAYTGYPSQNASTITSWRDPLNPLMLLFTLEELPRFYVRPRESFLGVAQSPGPYSMRDFWIDMGNPAHAIPDEDLWGLNSTYPPTSYAPGYCEDGFRFLVPSYNIAGTAWEGHQNEIATAHFDPSPYTGGFGTNLTWTFETPPDGYRVHVRTYQTVDQISQGNYYEYDAAAGAWTEIHDGVGWYLPYYRTIARLDDPGEAGQRARLIARAGTGGDYYTWRDVRSSPPENPISSVFFGVGPNATGAWAGLEGKIVRWSSGQWMPSLYNEGLAYVFGARFVAGKIECHHKYSKVYIPWKGQLLRYGPGYEYYEHNGTEWVLSEDQNSPPDVVECWSVEPSSDEQLTRYYVPGPHLWNQIQTGCKLLHTRAVSATLSEGLRKLGSGRASTVADARADAIAHWNTQSWYTVSAGGIRGRAINSLRKGSWYNCEVTLDRVRAKYKALVNSWFSDYGLARTVDVAFYLIAGDFYAKNPTFSPQGDSVEHLSAISIVSLPATAKTDEYTTTDYFGGEDAPCNPWHSDDESGFDAEGGGWDIRANDSTVGTGSVFAIEEWNVPGGFEYQ